MAPLYRLMTLLIQSGRCFVIISFAKSTGLVSEGIRFLITVFDQCKESRGRLILADLPPKVETTLRMTGVDDLLGPFVSLEDALDVLKVKFDDFVPGMPDFNRRLGTQNLVRKAMAAPAEEDVDTAAAPRDAMSESQVMDKAVIEGELNKAMDVIPDEMKERVEKSDSKRRRVTEILMAALEDHAVKPSDEDVEQLLSQHMPTRATVQVVDYFITHEKSVAEADEISRATGLSLSEIRPLLRELDLRGVLKPVGAGIYNFAPDVDLRKKIERFIMRWHHSVERNNLMRILARVESRRKGS